MSDTGEWRWYDQDIDGDEENDYVAVASRCNDCTCAGWRSECPILTPRPSVVQSSHEPKE